MQLVHRMLWVIREDGFSEGKGKSCMKMLMWIAEIGPVKVIFIVFFGIQT